MASRLVTLSLAAALAAGCGDFSNEDVVFRSAVPRRAELESNLKPDTQPAATVQQGLEAVGEPSEAYARTIEASTRFNNILYGLLGIFEKVLEHPPTRRTDDSRIWGPFRPKRTETLEAKVTITREAGDAAAVFKYVLEVRKDRQSPFIAFITGQWDAIVGGVRTGKGALTVHAKALRDAGIDNGPLQRVDSLSMTYHTAQDPLTVDMRLIADPTQSLDDVSAAYHFERFDAGDGKMTFEVEKNILGGLFSPNERLLAVSRWQASGAGRAELEIIEGDFVGSKQLECWNDARNLVHRFQSWDPGAAVGNAADCPVFEGP